MKRIIEDYFFGFQMRACLVRPGLFVAGVIVSVTSCASAPAANVPQRAVSVPSSGDVIARMITEGMDHSHVPKDLAYLTDVIGPRLTGSAGMRRANDWTAQKF